MTPYLGCDYCSFAWPANGLGGQEAGGKCPQPACRGTLRAFELDDKQPHFEAQLDKVVHVPMTITVGELFQSLNDTNAGSQSIVLSHDGQVDYCLVAARGVDAATLRDWYERTVDKVGT